MLERSRSMEVPVDNHMPTDENPLQRIEMLEAELERLRQANHVLLETEFDEAGRYLGKQAIITDTTGRANTENALRENEARIRRITDYMLDVVVQTDQHGAYEYISPSFRAVTGHDPETLLGHQSIEFVHPDDFQGMASKLQEVVATRTPTRTEYRYRHADGHYLWIEALANPVTGKNEEVAGIIIACRDITDRRTAEAALRESEQRYRQMTDLLPETVYEMDMTGRFTYVNATGLDKFGVTSEDVARGANVIDCVVPEDRERAARNVAVTLEGLPEPHEEYTALGKDGTTFPCVAYSSPVIQDGKIVGLRGFLIDITARKQAELAVRESEERYRSLVELSPDAIAVHCEGKLVFANEATAKLMRAASPEDILGRNVMDAVPAEYRGIVQERQRQLLEEGKSAPLTAEKFLRLDGTILDVEVSAAQITYMGKPAVQVVVRDVTERKLFEERLLRAQKLETAGKLAGQVAHDFNNLLGPLALYPSLIKSQLPEGHPAAEYCHTMLEAVQQMAEINLDMLALARTGYSGKEATDINRLVKQAVGQAGPLPGSLDLELELSSDLLPVVGSPGQLLRVVINLIANARHAMEDSGTLRLVTDNVYVNTPFGRYERIHVGQYSRLMVSDSGPGIPPEFREKIFEPFFTTKTQGSRRGSGLGLSIVQTIVEEHHGYIDLETERGSGTTFSIYLPSSAKSVKAEDLALVQSGNERILVVDDDHLQRQVLQTGLSRLGYRVGVVDNGEEALAYLSEEEVDLVLLDMVMPGGIDGTETYRRIRATWPQQRAILISGYAETDRVELARALGVGAYLRKPLTLGALAKTVREELDRD
jgi:two-component system, cell cycle sensor histidine kinase and response regulator CckA